VSAEPLYLTLRAAGELVAVPVARVKEIFEPEFTTPLPGAPRAFGGVINLRGSVVPVVDLGVALGLAEAPLAGARWVVLLELDIEGERTLLGLATDSVEEVVRLAAEEVESVPAFGTRIAADHLLGLGRLRGSFVLLLDLDRALASVGVRASATVAAASGAAARPPQS
jgi:purine-binding chemotaxis protein CheW